MATSLSSLFTTMFELVVNTNETWQRDQMVGHGSWNLKFVMPCYDWEVDLVVQLLCVLKKERVIIDGVDEVVWRGDGEGVNFVKEVFKRLQPRVDHFFPVKDIWMPNVPLKVMFYT